ncbi:MAG TPA: cell division protein ZipA [Rudaea sp.]|nr:cell division protein ZipA [Rudaea sp.]
MGWNPSIGIPLAIAGAIVLALIYFFGRPRKPGQGRRMPFLGATGGRDSLPRDGERVEPTLGDVPRQGELEVEQDAADDREIVLDPFVTPRAPAGPPRPAAGIRPEQPIDRIVTLFVSARAGQTFSGANLIVAAEKAGLTFGDMGIFHRLMPGKPQAGPVFSMANMIKPGNFDMRHVDELRTPGVSFFMTLPGPLPALDAWDAMLPTAQRLAELLDGNVLDEERNALGRQGVAHIRDELRAYDRKQERSQIRLR